MPTLSVHSFGNEHFETFYRPDPSSAGWFRSFGTLERVAFEVSSLVALWGGRILDVEFESRYDEGGDRRDFEKVLSVIELRTHEEAEAR